MIPPTLDALKVPHASLTPYARNARRGDIALLRDSLTRFGQYKPILVRARTNEVLAGNQIWLAAGELDWQEIAVTFVDVDDDTAARIVLIDNRAGDRGTYDEQALADLLGELPDLEGTGYEQGDLDALLESLNGGGGTAGTPGADTDPIDPPAEPRSRGGDLYVLGDHRLLCGDSTDALHVQRLLDGEAPDAVFTDPPYGIDYRDVKGAHRPIANDGADPTLLVRDALALLGLDTSAPVYLCCDWRSLDAMRRALVDLGIAEKACIVWDKQRGVQNLDRYFKQHEFVLYAGPYGGEKTLRGDVWAIPREPNPGDHPTPKPIDLIEGALSDAGGHIVCDPFGGSGSTLIAAENLGRRCFTCELDPGYCDVIVDRWERHTGRTAELVEQEAPA